VKLRDLGRSDRRLVLKHVRYHWEQERQHYINWEAEAEEYRAEGKRPHYCPHGMNLWVDYDVICGACEEGGLYWNPVAAMRYALDCALYDMSVVHERREILQKLYTLKAPVSTELFAWAGAPFYDFY